KGGPFNRLYDFDPDTDKVGPFHFADIPLAANLVTDPMALPYLMKTGDFFSKHANNLLVFNGVNMQTNNHDRGVTTTWSGRGDGNYPNFAALVAATRAPGHPLAFISSGGYDGTGNLIPVTRLNSVTSFRKLAEPNRVNPADPNNLNTYVNDKTFDRIQAAQDARLKAFQAKQHLPRVADSAGQLYTARGNLATLSQVALPDTLIDLPNEIADLERLMQQTQLAIAAFQAGLAVGVNLELGGFDTHANHDTVQVRQLAKLLKGIDYVVEQATAAGIYGDMVIMVGSDFGRGKGYNGVNAGDGKDHWPVSSAMFLSGDPSLIGAGRLIGGTDDVDQLPLPVDPDTLATLEPGDDTGVVVTAGHIHLALRELAGVSEGAPAQKFKLAGDILPFFG
ncbi:MAG: DUF1501 domain-containing protein, partial [Myxococcales bacterium]|nr:DUF1501 domain-containing protein [Myxococcales bacterium]